MSNFDLYPSELADFSDLSPRQRNAVRRTVTVAIICVLAVVGSIVVQSANPGAMQIAQAANIVVW